VYEFNQLSFCQFNVGVDGISLYFVLLTTFVTPIAILSDYTSIKKNIKYFLISFLMLETLQIFAFVSLDLLLFYIFFESILPIIFIVIVIYGHGENRFRSAFLLFLYTLAGSLPMLLSILYIYSYLGSTDFQLISLSEMSFEVQKLLWLSLPFSKVNLTCRDLNRNYYHTSDKFIISKKMKWLPENKEYKSLVVYC
jgi:NADH-ubiquinone oxidoreductase chain 4